MEKALFIAMLALILGGCSAKLSPSKKEALKTELAEMVKIDQIAANIPTGKYLAYSGEQWNKFKDSVYSSGKIRTEALFNKYGFLGFDKVGKEGSTNFWLLVQHCDKYPAFQQKILVAMDIEVKKENANPNNYAYLFDRVQINAQQKQKFGTQVTYDLKKTGRAIPKFGLLDSANVDNFRKAYKLGSLKEYLNQMTAMHYEMNKEYYQHMGLKEANLYP